jgi:hypothetical protein
VDGRRHVLPFELLSARDEYANEGLSRSFWFHGGPCSRPRGGLNICMYMYICWQFELHEQRWSSRKDDSEVFFLRGKDDSEVTGCVRKMFQIMTAISKLSTSLLVSLLELHMSLARLLILRSHALLSTDTFFFIWWTVYNVSRIPLHTVEIPRTCFTKKESHAHNHHVLDLLMAQQ